MRKDGDALMCDMAEYYHILNMEELPVRQLAALCAGLPDKSRSKMLLSGQKANVETILLSLIADRLGILVWQNTEDGREGRNMPESLYEILTSTGTKQKEFESYASGSDFDAAWKLLMEGEDT